MNFFEIDSFSRNVLLLLLFTYFPHFRGKEISCFNVTKNAKPFLQFTFCYFKYLFKVLAATTLKLFVKASLVESKCVIKI